MGLMSAFFSLKGFQHVHINKLHFFGFIRKRIIMVPKLKKEREGEREAGKEGGCASLV